MTPRDFVYWLQGFIELADPLTMGEQQVTQIKNHLGLVFLHSIDPEANEKTGKELLDKMHEHGPDVKYRC